MRFKLLVLLACCTAVLHAATLTTSLTSLAAFGNVYPYHSSTSLRYTVSGSALTGNVVITAPAGFEVSGIYGYGYSQSVTLVPTAGTLATTSVFVRFSPSAVGAASGNVSNATAGAGTVNVSVSGTCVAWAIPANYYSTVNTQTGAALKTVLYNKISSGATAVGYTPGVWNAYYTTDVQPNGKVWDIYATRFDQASPYEYTMGTNQCGNYSGEGVCYNREHSFPKSWFNDGTPMISDLFHILASDGKVNGMRDNYPYGVVSAPTWTSQYGGKLGPNTYPGYTGSVFEPIDEYKGDLARGYLFMATRYENVIASWQSFTGANAVLNGTSFPAFNPWHINLLLAWNNLDPVSDKEMKRNNAIYALQNNRNPFIDSPQLAQRIWGGALPDKPTIAATSFNFSNKTNTTMQLNWTGGNGSRRIVVMRAGASVNGTPSDSTHYMANAAFGSGAQVGTGNYVVYNGTGSTVNVTGLTQGTNYFVTVFEYNGWYSTCNYQTSGALSSNSNTLPVVWLSFHATLESNKDITLQWQTASELNNDHFDVERSFDGVLFGKIGQRAGAGNSSTVKTYTFTDDTLAKNPAADPGNIYYRIRQVDADGQSSYSDTEVISFSTGLEALSELIKQSDISPNPFSDDLRISFTGKPQILRLSVRDMSGRVLVEKQIEHVHENEIKLTGLHHLPAGVYGLQIQLGSGRQQNFKLIKN